MKKFEIGKIYKMRFIGDASLIVSWTVTKRTASTVTITDGTETKTCRIIKALSESAGCEIIKLGSYSMAPIIRAA